MRLPRQLLQRKNNAHKQDFGHIFILAGSLRFSGAGLLCAQGTMRSGAGLVTLGIPKKISKAIIRIKSREAMILPLSQTQEGTLSFAAYGKIIDFMKTADVLIMGPGLSRNKSTQSLVRKIINHVKKPIVLDADGLNALVGHLDILRKTKNRQPATILTPHPGEMARLLGTSIKKLQSNRIAIARKFAKDYNCTVVLKGHRTVVADSKGKVYINRTGNPGMATAGSGDVLTGIIGAFLGQGLNAFEAAEYAVYLHGLAGDLAAKEKTEIGMIASDIIAEIPEAIKRSS
jgi:NAD(P)H-hydrate epimerase